MRSRLDTLPSPLAKASLWACFTRRDAFCEVHEIKGCWNGPDLVTGRLEQPYRARQWRLASMRLESSSGRCPEPAMSLAVPLLPPQSVLNHLWGSGKKSHGCLPVCFGLPHPYVCVHVCARVCVALTLLSRSFAGAVCCCTLSVFGILVLMAMGSMISNGNPYIGGHHSEGPRQLPFPPFCCQHSFPWLHARPCFAVSGNLLLRPLILASFLRELFCRDD